MEAREAIDRRYAEVLHAWRERLPRTRDELAAALVDYRVYFAYNSGRIENESITYRDTREVFEEDKLAYYGAIQVFDDEGDLSPMLDFLRAETVKTWMRGL